MELRDAEAVGVLDHHHRRVGDVDADLDHRRATRARRARRRGRRPSPLPSPCAVMLAVQEPDPTDPANSSSDSRSCSSVRGPRLDLVGLLDERAHHVGLPTCANLVVHLRHAASSSIELCSWPPGPAGLRPHRAHRRPARRQLVEHGHVEVAVHGHRRGAGNRRGRHHQHVRTVPWPSPLPRSAARCSTPKRCCSSITTTPRALNATCSVSRAWVPTRMSTVPSDRPRR